MNRATAHIPDSAPQTTSVENGMAALQQLFAQNAIPVASITLYRKGQTEKRIDYENHSGPQRTVEGLYVDVRIVVSVVGPIPPDVNAHLQAATTSAAAAAATWLDSLRIATESPIFGPSKTMRTLDQAINRVARSNHIVLITGESGTGKTTAAEFIHNRSRRASAPFVDVNCAALPENLIESELFGYEKGAFTGAFNAKKGRFEEADGGTLFLDEIGELRLDLQAKLLKAIEQKKVRRLGGTKDTPCDVRILAASSRNLQRMVKDGTFREDLYYRLAVLEIDIPPLRDRQDDIRDLVTKQLVTEQLNAELSEPLQLEPRALTELVRYSWPGNIRQLFNVLARLACHAPTRTISLAQVRSELDRFRVIDTDTFLLPEHCRSLLAGESLNDFSARVRGAAIEVVKERCQGNMTRTAERLQLDRASLGRVFGRIQTRTEKTSQGKLSAVA